MADTNRSGTQIRAERQRQREHEHTRILAEIGVTPAEYAVFTVLYYGMTMEPSGLPARAIMELYGNVDPIYWMPRVGCVDFTPEGRELWKLLKDYFQALARIPEQIALASQRQWDSSTLRICVGALAIVKGDAALGLVVMNRGRDAICPECCHSFQREP